MKKRIEKKAKPTIKENPQDELNIPVHDDKQYVQRVKKEMQSNHFDIERVKKAYELINGIAIANNKVMRLTILNYNL